MKRSQRLTPVIQLAEKAEQEALAQLGQANNAWHRDTVQLDDLIQYKGEYLQRFRQGEMHMLGTQKMMELRGFLRQLDQAIEVQKQQVSHSLNLVEHQKSIWLQKRTKAKALQLLVERYQGNERAFELRKEQLDNDEFSINQWRRSRTK
jgi:flagellar FliJ protein